MGCLDRPSVANIFRTFISGQVGQVLSRRRPRAFRWLRHRGEAVGCRERAVDPSLNRTLGGGQLGARMISASSDRTIKLWSLNTGEALVSFMSAPDGAWLAITPEGFFVASKRGADLLSVVRGFDVYSIDQLFQALYRPDLVREKLAGDPKGLVREAAAKLDLDKVIASGAAPAARLVSPRDGERVTAEEITVEADVADQGGGIGRIEW